MIFSRDKFFDQPINVLAIKKEWVSNVLHYKNIPSGEYLKAYDYFVKNGGFDGATIVKDLTDIQGLDLSALLHDYRYIVELKKYHSWRWLFKKIKYDFEYAKSMELMGKGITIPYLRFIGLLLSTPFYLLLNRK